MYRKALCGSVVLFASILVAADPPWINKQIAEWTEQDAWQVLSSSPWVKKTPSEVLPGLSQFQRRDSGDMNAQGGKDGVGIGGLLPGNKGATDPTKGTPAHSRKMDVRWESALPIRAAEIRVNEPGAPVLDGEEYAIAVYDVSLKTARLEFKSMKDELKKFATLKIEGKKDVRPVRVAVLELGDGVATVIYLFPRSARITLEDKRIEFSAQIGRIVLAQYFYPQEMQFQGKLAL